MTRLTTALPVSGRSQVASSLGLPSLAVCSMVTITDRAPWTRSMAPPMPFDHFPGHHPVGEVTGGGDLHRAEDGDVDVAAADHRETGGGVEERRPGQHRHGLFAGVDQVRVDVARLPGTGRPRGCRSRTA